MYYGTKAHLYQAKFCGVREPTNVREKNYIFAPDGLAAIYVKREGMYSANSMYYTSTDHLGSINMVVDEQGNIWGDLSYDAWGRRRNAQNWSYTLGNLSTTAITDRGYTGHEHMDAFNLINMNGRAYDAKLGQFLSPDPFVQAPENTQSYNRYAYCINNPLKYTDPSGYNSTSNNADRRFLGNWNNELDFLYHRGIFSMEGGFEGTTAFFTNGGSYTYGIGSFAGGMLGDDFVASSKFQETLDKNGISRNGGQWGTWSSVLSQPGPKYSDVSSVEENVFTPLNVHFIFEDMTPEIYRNTSAALFINPQWSSLTYNGGGKPKQKNRYNATKGVKSCSGNNSRDEFPYATTMEGGIGAYVNCVPIKEQSIQAGQLLSLYGKMKAGDKFKVVLIPKLDLEPLKQPAPYFIFPPVLVPIFEFIEILLIL